MTGQSLWAAKGFPKLRDPCVVAEGFVTTAVLLSSSLCNNFCKMVLIFTFKLIWFWLPDVDQ